ncbi:ATP-binding cassette domain-containing protein [Falsiroseomonas sp. HW251]|uniref:ATP-binding cassette domain-containing protein n=1 Tax=Falsiroseomonas sp. HW251 TaxID=3390998 RepID=UPI003D31D09C
MSAALRLPAPAPAARPALRGRAELWIGFATCVALSVAAQGAVLVTPLLTMHVFDGVLESRSYSTLVVLAIAFAVALLLSGLLRELRAALLAGIAERVGRRLQLRALTASVRVALGGEGHRPALALQDVAEMRRLLGGTMLPDLLDLMSIPVALGFLWLLHPLFFEVALCALVAKAGIAVAADRATRVTIAEATGATAAAASGLSAALRQPEAVRGLGMMPAVLRGWLPGWLAALDRQDRAQRRARALQGLLMLADFAQQMAIVTAGAWLLIGQATSPGAMLAATTMVGFATNPVVALVARWRDWAYGLLAWRRLRALAASGEAPAPAPRDASAPDGLVIEDVTVRVPAAGRDLVRNLSMRIAPGEVWAVLGPNGIGKTSLLRAVLGLAAPATGRVLLDGQDTHRADRGVLGPRIGYLAQEPLLLQGSVMDNIGRFAEATPEAAVAAARRAGAHDAIGRLARGYETQAGAGTGLSGGQQRLVALSRALLGSPRLLVLDEPEAALDAAAREGLHRGVSEAARGGAVVLLVTHDARPWTGRLDGTLRLTREGGWTVERMERAA